MSTPVSNFHVPIPAWSRVGVWIGSWTLAADAACRTRPARTRWHWEGSPGRRRPSSRRPCLRGQVFRSERLRGDAAMPPLERAMERRRLRISQQIRYFGDRQRRVAQISLGGLPPSSRNVSNDVPTFARRRCSVRGVTARTRATASMRISPVVVCVESTLRTSSRTSPSAG